MNELQLVFGILAIIALLLIAILFRKNPETSSNQEYIKLFQSIETNLKNGLSELRTELRVVSTDNRREIQESFKNQQDTLLKRISENSAIQIQQLNSFKTALSELSEKLINNSNDFKESVSNVLQTSNESQNKKQDEFRDKTVFKLESFEETIKKDAQLNRQELKTNLTSFEEKFNAGIKEFNEQLRVQFVDANKKQDDFSDKTVLKLDGFEETIKKDAQLNRQELKTNLTSFEEKFNAGIKEFNEQLRVQFVDANKKQDDFSDKTVLKLDGFEETIKKDAQLNRQELKTNLISFEEKFNVGIKEFNEQLRVQFVDANKKQDNFSDKTVLKLDGFEETIKKDAQLNRQELKINLTSFEEKFNAGIKDFNEQLRVHFNDLTKQQSDVNLQSKNSMLEIKQTIDAQLKAIREDNNTKLNEMRQTVDEKLHDTLEKRLGESFKLVSDRLEQVHKGLGEMQNLAIGVGDLKKVLSNVKTRGILGEYQLGNILEQILSPDQYAVNVATKQGSRANVEFAVKLPGKADEKTVWLPIDSKFPLESYQALLLAWDEGNLVNIDVAQKALIKAVESFAKDISSKYIDPPHTTDFAIMFLPVESLYAEVLRHPELFERLQRTYRITITGPTTLSALLNSLSMGFRTLAVQKRSSEVWKVLAEVKTEFIKYSEQLAAVHKHINSASNTLETLQTTRTKVMERKLRGIEVLELSNDTIHVPLLEDD